MFSIFKDIQRYFSLFYKTISIKSSYVVKTSFYRLQRLEIFRVWFTECRIGNVAAHGCKFGKSSRYTSADGDGTKADGHRLGSQQHPFYCRERPRQTGQRLQEVLVRAESAHCARVHHELFVHGRSTCRDSLHGKWVSATEQPLLRELLLPHRLCFNTARDLRGFIINKPPHRCLPLIAVRARDKYN